MALVEDEDEASQIHWKTRPNLHESAGGEAGPSHQKQWETVKRRSKEVAVRQRRPEFGALAAPRKRGGKRSPSGRSVTKHEKGKMNRS